ncbi:ABC transporter ATP-binding protein [Fusobacterium massiliense]|uniref:ABC transporter ATP-binding protein n=1 Tax=Fusobacterium massiliense TaxID=1852365 RepID=UPI0028E68EBC|nr:ABC transporter ATP-binding protein [Fusobacterium massiliense]
MKPLLEIKNLNINYKNSIKAVKNVSLTLEDNQIISIVGESGSGKSTLIRAILKLLPMGGEIESGNIFFLEKNILNLNKNELNKLRGKDIGMIFQDPNSTMDPIKTIGKQFVEYILEHNNISKKEAIDLAKKYLLKLNLTDVERVFKSYPFELSGGMKQRVSIAMAMAQSPKLLLADEPTSALDVTIQAQVINELKKIRENFKTSIILVTHNMGVAAYISDKIAVMINGEIIEFGDREQIIKNPQHDYTKSLLNAIINLK